MIRLTDQFTLSYSVLSWSPIKYHISQISDLRHKNVQIKRIFLSVSLSCLVSCLPQHQQKQL